MTTPTMQTISPFDFLIGANQERADLRSSLALLDLCAVDAPQPVTEYARTRYHQAAQPPLVAALLAHYESPPAEPKRPRLTAPVRRGLQEMVRLLDNPAVSDDVRRAVQWIAEECAFSGDVTWSAQSAAVSYDGTLV